LITQFENEVVPRYLRQQRWFAAKNQTLTRTTLADVGRWRTARGEWLLSFIDGQFANSAAQRYFLPLAVDWGTEQVGPAAGAALARVRQQSKTGLLFDALADPAFSRDLVAALGTGEPLRWSTGAMHFMPTAACPEVSAESLDELAVRRTATEASNASVLLGNQFFLKAYRRLREGVNPEWEMSRFLTDISPCGATVPALGAIEYRPATGGPCTLALIQSCVKNQGDGWQYTLQYLERHVEDVVTRSEDGADVEAEHANYLLLMRALGARTADLHRALALEAGLAAFDPEPLDRAHLEAWAARLSIEVERTLDQLGERRGEMGEVDRAAVERLLEERDALAERVSALAAEPVDAVATRHHGDYHLGQVLLTEGDFVIIDLEGEPGRTFDERRTKTTALKDVAGMLRSFRYAAAVIIRDFAADHRAERALVEPLVARWREQAESAFLAAYRAAIEGCAVYPRREREAARLLELARIEKLLYELRYELDNRPDWLEIPLQNLLSLLAES
jgi:maltose alpha-D-glucosyltransferase/alpha-amylase